MEVWAESVLDPIYLQEAGDGIPNRGLLLQCTVSGLSDYRAKADTLRVTVQDSEGHKNSAEYDCSQAGFLSRAVSLPLQYEGQSMEGSVSLFFEAFDSGRRVAKEEITRLCMLPDEIVWGLKTLPDSLYLRTYPFDFIGEEKSGEINSLCEEFCVDAEIYIGPPAMPLEDARKYMAVLKDVTDNCFIYENSERNGSFCRIGNIYDLESGSSATPECAGLLFFRLAAELNLEPVFVMNGGRCFAGIRSQIGFGSESDHMFIRNIVAESSDLFRSCAANTYLLTEINGSGNFPEGLPGPECVILCSELQKRRMENLKYSFLDCL